MLNKKNFRLSFLLPISILFLGGCAGPGKYVLTSKPTQDTKAFKNVEVAKVEVGITKDELDPETTTELRMAIIEQIKLLHRHKPLFKKRAFP